MGGQIQPVTVTADVVGGIKSVIAAEEAVARDQDRYSSSASRSSSTSASRPVSA